MNKERRERERERVSKELHHQRESSILFHLDRPLFYASKEHRVRECWKKREGREGADMIQCERKLLPKRRRQRKERTMNKMLLTLYKSSLQYNTSNVELFTVVEVNQAGPSLHYGRCSTLKSWSRILWHKRIGGAALGWGSKLRLKLVLSSLWHDLRWIVNDITISTLMNTHIW